MRTFCKSFALFLALLIILTATIFPHELAEMTSRCAMHADCDDIIRCHFNRDKVFNMHSHKLAAEYIKNSEHWHDSWKIAREHIAALHSKAIITATVGLLPVVIPSAALILAAITELLLCIPRGLYACSIATIMC
jgi:hypothetical protein